MNTWVDLEVRDKVERPERCLVPSQQRCVLLEGSLRELLIDNDEAERLRAKREIGLSDGQRRRKFER